MASVNISIREDVYDELRRRRAEGESFSDVIERLLRQPGRLSDLAGAWASVPTAEWAMFQRARAERRAVEVADAKRRARRDR